MFKKVIWIVLLAAVLIGACYYFLFFKQVFDSQDPIALLPPDAALIWEIHEPKRQTELIESDSIWFKLYEYAPVNKLFSELKVLDRIVKTGNGNGYMDNAMVYATMQKAGAIDMGIIYIMENNKDPGSNLKKMVSSDSLTVSHTVYKGFEIKKVKDRIAGMEMSLADINGVIVASSLPFLVEEVIGRLGAKDENRLSSSSGFRKALSFGSKNKDLKVYVNFSKLPLFLSIYTNQGIVSAKSGLVQLAEWAVVDLKTTDDAIYLNGYLITDKESSFLNELLEVNRESSGVFSVLPFNTALHYSINTNSLDPLINKQQNAKGRLAYEKYFMNWCGTSIGFAITEPFSPDYTDNCFVVVSATDTGFAKQNLFQMVRDRLNIVEIMPNRYKGYEIVRLVDFDDLESAVGLESTMMKDPYFCIIEDYVVFANNIGNLKLLIERYIGDETLGKDPDYLTFKDQLADKHILNLFINTGRLSNLMQNISNPSFKKYLTAQPDQFSSLNPVGIQITPYKDNIFLINGLIQTFKSFQKTTNLLWKTELDTICTRRPQVVTNHNDRTNEIIVQDAKNNFYLVTSGGRIIWKHPLDDQIIGEVFQVDFYRNGKLQYLFSTKKSIHLIDRKGRNVENFPLRTSDKIISGLSVIDYDNNGDYRMFVGCANGNVYGYRKSGQPLPGWSPKRNLGQIPFPIKHFIIDNKDYLMIQTGKGSIYLYNRKGEERIRPVHCKVKFNQPFSVELIGDRDVKLLNLSENGILYSINQKGRVRKDSIEGYNQGLRFIYKDINSNDTLDYIIMDNYSIRALEPSGEEIFYYLLPEGTSPSFYSVPGPQGLNYLGFVNPSVESIYMIGNDGELHPDFPLDGILPFDISYEENQNEYILYTGLNDNTITSYRLR